MTEPLADEYPEAAPDTQQAVGEHGGDWVLERYYERLHPPGRPSASSGGENRARLRQGRRPDRNGIATAVRRSGR